jgi:pyruvate dehydrogenase E2 component (dihydrolipoamide acetyltransferase)
MATGVIMPKSGISVETCILTGWNKKVGDQVKKGEILFSYETDKSAFEEVAPRDGILLAAFFAEGDDVPVMVNVGVIGESGEDVSVFKPDLQRREQNFPYHHKASTRKSFRTPEKDVYPEGQQAISPRARRTARRLSVPTSDLQGTGPHGRIIERDVLNGAAADADWDLDDSVQPESVRGIYTDVELTHIRKLIARNISLSLTTIPQLTHTLSFDATAIVALRAKFKEDPDPALAGITLNDMLLFAVSRTLPDFPELNAHLLGDSLRLFRQVNLGMAVDTPRGLMVPVIYGANRLSLRELAAKSKELAALCQAGDISPDLLHGGSFTVTNLGSLHIEHFTPVIDPPQTGILGVDSIVQRVREVEGRIAIYPAMGLSLTFDHRALDGGPASRFLMKLQENLESFPSLLNKEN